MKGILVLLGFVQIALFTTVVRQSPELIRVSNRNALNEAEEKRLIAADLLQELRSALDLTGLTAMYVRDFNLADKDLAIYYELDSGETSVQGCYFEAQQTPHCVGWHLYGQSPTESIKSMIMEDPYRIYPPMGSPSR